MFHTILSNLVLILFLLCSSINIIQQGEAFKFAPKPYSNSIKLRVWYPRLNQLVTSIKVGNSNEIQMKNKNDYWIQKLEPCTTYTIEAVVRNTKSKIEFIHSENITTNKDFPRTDINQVIPSQNSVNISFNYTNFNCVERIEISLNELKIALIKKSNLTQSYFIEELAPCTSYKLLIQTYPGKAGEVTNATKHFTTESVERFSIENIEYDDQAELLRWTSDFGRECIKSYDIKIENDFDGTTASTSSESFNLTDYPGCSKFNISITPKGINGEVFNRSQIEIQTGIKEPSLAVNLPGNSSSDSITINWNSPNENPGCVKNYAIAYYGKKKYTNLTTYTVQNLEPCLEYSIQVCLIMINDKIGKCTNISMATKIGIPSKVNDFRILFLNSIRIYWGPPLYGANCTNNYNVTVNEESGKLISTSFVSSPEFQINISELKSCHNYSVYVTPINRDSVLGSTDFITLTTKPTKPNPPTAPSLKSKTATSLELQSDYNSANDYCPLRAAFFECQEKETTTTTQWANISLIENERQFIGNVSNLKDLTTYICTARVANEKYLSDPSKLDEFETNEKVADPPQITIISKTFGSFTFSWRDLDPRIKLKGYHVIISRLGKNYQMPDGCQDEPYNKSYQIDTNLLNYEITNLKPYTKYTVQMAIENTAGIGNYSEPIHVITEPYIPHQVINFTAKVSENQTVELKWNLPCEINGQIISMAGILYEGQPINNTFEWRSVIVEGDKLSTNYYLGYKLKPDNFYNITIEIELNNFTGPTNLTSFSFSTPAGIPEAYNSSGWGSIGLETNPPNNVDLIIDKNLFSSTNGKILKFTFLISERFCYDDPTPHQMFFISENDYTKLLTWYDFTDDECTEQYQLEEYRNDFNFDEIPHFHFILGNETCDKETRDPMFCNGPLKSDTDYAVIARIFTSNGYADTQPIFFKTSNSASGIIVLLIILSIMVVGFFSGLGFVRFKLKYLDMPLSATDIPVKSFLTFYSHMEVNLIVKEYESFNGLDLREYTTNEAKTYKEKNRYANILPYDQNRVLLTPNAYCTSDYINASYIDGYKRKHEYIASQGPKPETSYDFWDMIIETKCHKIVMVTKLVENGITKCFQYYPDENAELQLGDITISSVKEDNLEIFTRREIKITKGMAKRLIVQYHFQKWPDHDCPENEMDLIKFIQFLKSENSSSHPIVVHCSAGVGRTGTLISLDMLMQQVQNDKHLNIYETVKKLRYQRVKMVQTFEQYQFLYKSVAKYVQWKWPTRKN